MAWHEVLVLLAIALTLILLAVVAFGYTSITRYRKKHCEEVLLQNGAEIYKMIASQTAGRSDGAAIFPARTDGFVSSTHYFQSLLSEAPLETARQIFIFTGPGLPHLKDNPPEKTAWNVVLDVQSAAAETPLLLSRNFLANRAWLPGKDAHISGDTFSDANARERLRVDGHAATIITRSGRGYVLRRENLAKDARAEMFNPGDHRGLILRP